MLHVQDPCTDARSAIDGQLVMAALRGIQVELSTMRGVLENVERTSSNNAQRLEAIDSRLREAATAPGAAAASQAPQPAMRTPDKVQMAYAAAGILSLLLIIPRLRRLLLRSLRTIPLSLLAIAQLSASSALLAYRGQDLLGVMLTGSPSITCAHSTRRRQLCYCLLMASVAAVPAKGVAHLLLTDARGRKRPAD